jgi:hypothetical protein
MTYLTQSSGKAFPAEVEGSQRAEVEDVINTVCGQVVEYIDVPTFWAEEFFFKDNGEQPLQTFLPVSGPIKPLFLEDFLCAHRSRGNFQKSNQYKFNS